MEHEAHLTEDVDRGGAATKLIALAIIVAVFLAAGVYLVYGSGMWNPPHVMHPG